MENYNLKLYEEIMQSVYNHTLSQKIRELLENNSFNVNDVLQFQGKTLFHIVSQYGDKKDLDFLIEKGSDIFVVSENGANALHFASINGNIENIKFLLSLGFDSNSLNNNYITPLHYACNEFNSNFPETVKVLIENGADINFKKYDWTNTLLLEEISRGSKNGHINRIKVLLDNGAILDEENEFGIAKALGFWNEDYSEIIDVLYSYRAKLLPKTIFNTVNHSDYPIEHLSKLYEIYKFDINVCNEKGNNLLFDAMVYNNNSKQTINWLLEKGIKYKANNEGVTPIQNAIADIDLGRQYANYFSEHRKDFIHVENRTIENIKILLESDKLNISEDERELVANKITQLTEDNFWNDSSEIKEALAESEFTQANETLSVEELDYYI
ncbi:MAG: ankyrin repeat domain-containing protein [Sphingobacteriia bacterium]|nr:ankyrin repeat domain-containing protein [Sphingobacteriia bacterium]